ncbi:tubulin-tyrosine ligase [Pilatotrama ljubarskyi]|nr:tubulin-tyrosine ligase [Pilatotrama ljubarskyi]
MEDFTAFVSWPSAPLTDRLVRNALDCISPKPTIVTSLHPDLVSSPGRLLQWATYDALDHALTFSHTTGSKVLSSSYVIRKALIRKHFLSRCIHNYLTKHPDSILSWGVPRTWELELSFADELDELWGDDLYDLSDEIDKGDPAKWWILKPGMADRGMGLRLFRTKEQLQAIFEEFEQDDSEDEAGDEEGRDAERRDTAVVTSQLRHFVIQEYLGNPLLLDPAEVPLDGSQAPPPQNLHGHKFHLRVYCVASGAIKLYVYDRILALFSAVPYTPPSQQGRNDDTDELDLAAHLTNTSLQTDRGEAGVRLLDELVGCHVLSSPAHGPGRQQPKPRRAMGQAMDPDSISAAKQQQAEGTSDAQFPTVTSDDVSEIKRQIAGVLSETFKAAVEMSVHFQPLPNAFELYGIDFVVTHDPSPIAPRKFQVNLLEINSEPAIELTGPRLTWILEDLFKGIAKTCIVPFFATDGSPVRDDVQSWQEGEMKENLRKCLYVEVRGAQGW